MDEKQNESFRSRDAATATVLGSFLMILSLPVLAAVFLEFKQLQPIDRNLNIVTGSIILLIGAGFVGWGRRLKRLARDERD